MTEEQQARAIDLLRRAYEADRDSVIMEGIGMEVELENFLREIGHFPDEKERTALSFNQS